MENQRLGPGQSSKVPKSYRPSRLGQVSPATQSPPPPEHTVSDKQHQPVSGQPHSNLHNQQHSTEDNPQNLPDQTHSEAMNPEEERLLKMYGRLPTRSEMLNKKLKDRKFFDSGDYALKKAGQQTQIGSEHPVPEIIPHHSTSPPQSRHPSVSMGSSVTTAFEPGNIAAHEVDAQLKALQNQMSS